MLFTHLKEVVRHKKPDRLHFYFHILERKKVINHPFFHLQNQNYVSEYVPIFQAAHKPRAKHCIFMHY